MKPLINDTKFGSITIAGEELSHDVVVHSDGKIEKRKKKLSKAKYGTSHMISVEEAKYILDKGAQQLIIGTGQTGYVKLSPDAAAYFKDMECEVLLILTPRAISAWNDASADAIGLFHVTC